MQYTVNGIPLKQKEANVWLPTSDVYCPVCNVLIFNRKHYVYDITTPFDNNWWFNTTKSDQGIVHPQCRRILELNPLAYGL